MDIGSPLMVILSSIEWRWGLRIKQAVDIRPDEKGAQQEISGLGKYLHTAQCMHSHTEHD